MPWFLSSLGTLAKAPARYCSEAGIQLQYVLDIDTGDVTLHYEWILLGVQRGLCHGCAMDAVSLRPRTWRRMIVSEHEHITYAIDHMRQVPQRNLRDLIGTCKPPRKGILMCLKCVLMLMYKDVVAFICQEACFPNAQIILLGGRGCML